MAAPAKKEAKVELNPLKEEAAGRVREVGAQGVWSLSSCKPGECRRILACFKY